MELNQEIYIGDIGGRSYAKATHCDLALTQSLFGYRLGFRFKIQPLSPDQENPVSILGREVDVFYKGSQGVVPIGRAFPGLADHGEERHEIGKGEWYLTRQLDLSSSDFARLVEITHSGDMAFEFEAAPQLHNPRHNSKANRGVLVIPQSEWIEYLNRGGMDRFELITVRIPIRASHSHAPFVNALGKIRQAEAQCNRGEWNAAVASCRAAWRTVLSVAPSGTQPFEHLLSSALVDPKRKGFARAVIKGLHDILNEGVHLEGDIKNEVVDSNLIREDAL
jgi:hypothetical protein